MSRDSLVATTGVSQLFLSHACSTVFSCGLAWCTSRCCRRNVLTSDLFPGTQVLLSFVGDLVSLECIAGWPVFEGLWNFVFATGTLTAMLSWHLATSSLETRDIPVTLASSSKSKILLTHQIC